MLGKRKHNFVKNGRYDLPKKEDIFIKKEKIVLKYPSESHTVSETDCSYERMS